ncbi:hypothetical protein L218DRAFT_965451 [Marasmius fiardii PR-910]|nr:hypothetical protein L218DRAFT_965451 [Marasmius fiardii PR-910]
MKNVNVEGGTISKGLSIITVGDTGQYRVARQQKTIDVPDASNQDLMRFARCLIHLVFSFHFSFSLTQMSLPAICLRFGSKVSLGRDYVGQEE